MIVQPIKRFTYWLARVANYDFCPSWNSFFYWLKEPFGWVVAAIAFSLLIGVLVGPQGYVLAIAFTTLLILGMAWPWISMRGVRCRLVPPEGRTSENQNVEVVFRVKNYWPLPVFGMMVKGDFLQDINDGDEPVAFALKHIPAWSESEFRIPLSPRRRGRLPTGDVVTTNGFPFGLIDISKTVTHPTTAIVWPACEPLEALPITESTRFSLNGALRDISGEDGESIGVRCHRNGDRLRNIHWAQTVRTQRLMVRERQKLSAADSTIVLDLTPATHSGRGSQSSYEWTIRIAASICSHLHESQSLVRVVCIGLQDSAQMSADNRLGLRAILDFLAELPVLQSEQELESTLDQAPVTEKQTKSDFQIGGRMFLIGTNRSTQLPEESLGQVIPVILDATGFDETEQESSRVEMQQLKIDEKAEQPNKTIFITGPDSATDQLADHWNRSFEDGY